MSNPALEKVLKDAGLTDGALVTKVALALVPVLKEATDAAATAAAAKAKADAEAEMAAKKKDDMGDAPVQKEDGSWDFTKVPSNQHNIWKEKIASDAKLALVTKQLDEEREVRVTKEFAEKAGGYKHLGVKTEDLGLVMKELSRKAPEAFKVFEPILKGLDEKIAKSGMYGEIGTSHAGGSIAPVGNQTEAEAAIAAIAKGYVEKDGTGKLTKEQAVAKAWSENKELYNQHRAEVDKRRKSA